MKTKPDLSFWKLWNLSFGFFGVQIAYSLQSANISRIFATLGADPHSKFLLGTTTTHGNACTAHRRNTERQNLDAFRSPYSLFVYRCSNGSTGNATFA